MLQPIHGLLMQPIPPYAAANGGEEVERMIWASMATSVKGIYDQMERIRESEIPKNLPVGVHAALLHQSGWFVLWAEGPGSTVRELLARTSSDARYHGLRVMHQSRGQRLLLTPWSMMLSASKESTESFGLRVIAMRRQMDQRLQFAPTSVIRRLAAPLQLQQAHRLADPESFHRVGVCSAGNEAFDLVNWLGEHEQVPTARRRIAGERDLDSASDYVDLMHQGQPCRVIAVSRQGLQHGLRRAFLPEWPLFLLLLSGQARHDDALMSRIVAACRGLPYHPEFLGVAPDLKTHQRMAAMAATESLVYICASVGSPKDLPAAWRAVGQQLQSRGAPRTTLWPLLEPLAA
jgi:Sensors of blue-light using FAD